MRRSLLLVACCLMVSACASQTDREAKADEAWCANLGIHPGDARYADCRIAAAQSRAPRQFMLPAPPLGSPIPCNLYGNSTACEWVGQRSI